MVLFLPPFGRRRRTPARAQGFTLVELLVAMAILSVLLVLLLSVLSKTGHTWQQARDMVGAYQRARLAFEHLTRELSQSTLNVYQGYDDPGKPTKSIRKSDLHFVVVPPPVSNFGQGNAVFFQAPLGKTLDDAQFGEMPGLLNSIGYYVTYGKDASLPAFLQPFDRNRFRLMQFLDSSEHLAVYTEPAMGWFQGGTRLADNSVVLANNIILLLVWPRTSVEEDPEGDDLSTDYSYDSRLPAAPATQTVTTNQQPPVVQVTMVALEEISAKRLPDTAAVPDTIKQALDGLFKVSNETSYSVDLAELEKRLNSARIGYRVFSSKVPLLESKWSKE